MSFPQYPAYKASGVEWLGPLPAHWNLTRLKHCLISLDQGWSPLCESRPAEAQEWGVLKVGCVNGSMFNPRENKALPSDLAPAQEYALQQGDVLVSRANTRELVGSAAVVREDYPNLLLCDKLYRLRVAAERLDSEFATLLLRTPLTRSQIEIEATGASQSMQNIAQDTIRNLIFGLPPLPEQRAIAAFLDAETARIDALIAKQEALIATLQEKRRALISHAVTKGLDPAVPMRDSGVPWLGEVPAHWAVTKIKHLAQIGNGSTPLRENTVYWENGTFPWLTSTVVNDNYVGEPTEFVTEIALKECHLPIVKPNSILVAITGQGKTRGMAAMLGYTATINQHMAFIEANEFLLKPEFLQMVLIGKYDVLRMISEGAGSTKGALTCEDLANFSLPLPDLQEQASICRYVDCETAQIDTLIAKAQALIELLREHRTALIAAAVTGQIDVRGYVDRNGTSDGP